MVTAADIMTRDVITVQADAPLREALFKLVEDKISGMPVVDENDELVGIITEKDMLNYVLSGTLPQTVVREAMTKDVITFPPDISYEKLCLGLIEHTFRRFLIVEGKKVVGIVARRDLLREVSRFYGEV